MKAKLNITIEEALLERAKVYALQKRISLSRLIEDYLKDILRASAKGTDLLEMVDKLKPDPKVVAESYRDNAFYENQKEKYGL